MHFKPTADLCDEEDRLGALHLKTVALRDFGGKTRFHGQVVTLRCFEDNSLFSEMLDQPGLGKVLVVDGGGSTLRALFGDQMADKAVRNQWAGVVINGVVRDIGQLKDMDIGVKALGTSPRKSIKRSSGEKHAELDLFGQVIKPGMWLFADEDGVVVLPAGAKL